MRQDKKTFPAKNKLKILLIYEKNRGGETIAFDNLAEGLTKHNKLIIRKIINRTQRELDLIPQIKYLISCTKKYAVHISKFGNYDWIIVSSYNYASSVIATRLFFGTKGKIAWYYHGNHIPYETYNPNLNFQEKAIELVTRNLVIYLHKLMIRSCSLVVAPSKFSLNLISKKFFFPESLKKTCSL